VREGDRSTSSPVLNCRTWAPLHREQTVFMVGLQFSLWLPSGMILPVEKTAIIVGKDYAFRERRITGSPFQRVRVLQHIRGNKWKAQWVEPNPGLTDYVTSGQIIVIWQDIRRSSKMRRTQSDSQR
jgi:hypothetical protein